MDEKWSSFNSSGNLKDVAKDSCLDKSFSEEDSSTEQPIWEEDALPPSYDSIFGHLKDAKDTSDNAICFFKKAVESFAATIGCTATLLILLALPMAMIVIGAQYKNECPVEPFIPIYLIVGGAIGMLKTVMALCQRTINAEDGENDQTEEQSMIGKFIDGVVNLFLFIWFIAGNIWVYSKYKPNFTPPKHNPFNYCHPTLYIFAFWVITSSYIVMGIICFCICCLGLCASCTALFVANTASK